MPVLLDTSLLLPGERADALHTALTTATAAHDLRLTGPPGEVHAVLEHWQLSPDVAVIRQQSSGVSHTRTGRHARRDGPERVVFVLHDGGPGRYAHGGGSCVLRRGALYVTDLSSCYSYTRPGHGTARIVQIERSALGLSAEQVRSASVRLQASPFYNLLRGHIAGLCDLAESLAPGDAAALAPVTAHLAGTLLRTAGTAGDPAAHGPPPGYLAERVVQYLRVNFRRPELSADEIAHEHDVSARYLFRQWSGQPETLAGTLLRIRLAAARDLLTARPRLPVGVIAHRCGFASASHFSRRFRAAYGISPAQYRQDQP